MTETLYFNGIRGDKPDEYVIPPQSAEQFYQNYVVPGQAKIDPKKLKKPEHLGPLIARPEMAGKLEDVGWGIIFPQAVTQGPSVAEMKVALEPLLKLRRQQAGNRFHIYEDNEGYRYGDPNYANRISPPGEVNPAKSQYYLLVAGSPADFPFEVQNELDVNHAVGRLCFATADEYRRYAENVEKVERGAAGLKLDKGVHLFAPAYDDATRISEAFLAEPIITSLNTGKPLPMPGGWAVQTYLKADASRARLGTLLGAGAPPAVLLTATHGLEYDAGSAERLSQQGALVCSWDGAQIGPDDYFAAQHVTGDVTGLIGFLFGCYTAGLGLNPDGTRAADPFVAALPTALLNHGALAVVGHVNTALGASFLWSRDEGSYADVDSFVKLLVNLTEGYPVGHAMDIFGTRTGNLASQALTLLNDDTADALAKSRVFAKYQDARSYVILGDPAVRVPGLAAPQARAEAAAPVPVPVTQPGSATTYAAPASGGAPVTIEVTPSGAVTVRIGAQPAQPLAAQPFLAAGAEAEFGLREDLSATLNKLATSVKETLGEFADNIAHVTVSTMTSDTMDAQHPQADAKLKAYTSVALEGDTVFVVPPDGVDAELWKLHLELVKQAIQYRSDILEMFVTATTHILSGK